MEFVNYCMNSLPLKKCISCNITNSISEFYKQKCHSNEVMVYCKRSFNHKVQARWVRRKIDVINLLGGQCLECRIGLSDSHYSIFELHHRDPLQKRFNWTKLRLLKWQTVVEEAHRCDLLCANCHRIRHWKKEQPRQDSNLHSSH